jgi:hypothetical protein
LPLRLGAGAQGQPIDRDSDCVWQGRGAEPEAVGVQLRGQARGTAPFCESNIVGSAVSRADVDDFWVPNHAAMSELTTQQIVDALKSSDRQLASRRLWDLRCLPSESASIDAVKTAWQTRDSSPPDSVIRYLDVRTEMAMCLAEASAASKSDREG